VNIAGSFSLKKIGQIGKTFCLMLFVWIFCCTSIFPQHKPLNGLQTQIEQISQTAKGRVGVALMLLETGESLSLNGNQHFPMQSVYKFPIAMAVLHQVDEGKLKLEQSVSVETSDLVPVRLHIPIRDKYPQGVKLSLKELLRYSVSESDGTACDVLLRVIGGAAAVMKYLRSLGVDGVMVVTTEKAMAQNNLVQYRNWAAPEQMIVLLKAFYTGRGLSVSSGELLLQWMIETPTGPKRIKGLLPAGTVIAHKTGSSGMEKGLARATNDVGIITLPDGRHLLIAVFVSDSRADDAERESVIARIAHAAWDFWNAEGR
jgi:beta-lactamase class A